jgi:uncharacterized protein YxjI
MLNRSSYFIREHVGLFKLVDTYDILDPESQQKIGEACEEVSGWLKVLRLIIDKRMMPTRVAVYATVGEGPQAQRTLQFAITRGLTLLRSRVRVLDAQGTLLGTFQSKLFSLGGGFRVFNAQEQEVADVKGDWKGWNFKFLSGGQELGQVTKKWAGLGKELFTTADNYIITISSAPHPTTSLLLLAAGLAIDTVIKEKSG